MALPGIPPWHGQDIVLYHGTLSVYVPSILQAVDVTRGVPLKDFGRGFYTTTNRVKAEMWANNLVVGPMHTAAVIQFAVSRDVLAGLDHLFFVRGGPNATDYWSFVQYCRTIVADHDRITKAGWFDIVSGPVSGSWKKQTVIPDADQISFHTPLAAALLDQSVKVQVI